MYCRNCGKDIGDSKFCPECGTSSGDAPVNSQSFQIGPVVESLKQKVKAFGHEKLFRIISGAAAAVNVAIRLFHNEIETEYSVTFAQDDYFVISEQGRTWMLVCFVVQLLLMGLTWYDAKKENIAVSKKTIILAAGLLLVQVVALMLKFPAPY